ncbi:radiation-inducible immediate-early gene IEX-1 [Thalassophryne amazonica]|uniref:radiation-inducible immediate-early gene IEX-1 n=1 Tax=Thalassophryne amazonica TaxID=390379 RepID=UPI00147139A6|nr:radiation-inducible immediate-early gene IEX-1 [Thalassophryne amazonica]
MQRMCTQSESFASFQTSRNTEPEVFTFERIPVRAVAARSYVPARPKRRCTRVMYPAKVRMHLPPVERSRAKRWLAILCLVVLFQIYTEEPCVDAPRAAAVDTERLCFQDAEARPIGDLLPTSCEDPTVPDEAGPGAGEDAHGGLKNSYMVALLVYHRLGGD